MAYFQGKLLVSGRGLYYPVICGDYNNHEIMIPMKQPGWLMESVWILSLLRWFQRFLSCLPKKPWGNDPMWGAYFFKWVGSIKSVAGKFYYIYSLENIWNPKSWRWMEDDFPDFNWVIFRFHVDVQGYTRVRGVVLPCFCLGKRLTWGGLRGTTPTKKHNSDI